MKAIYNNTTNSLIAFKGDHRPIQICKGGQLIDNISAVPLITEQDTYTSEYKANLIGLQLKGNTEQNPDASPTTPQTIKNSGDYSSIDYTSQIMDLIKSGNYSQAGVSGVALVNVPSELVDKNITYYLSASLPSGYSVGLLKGSNFLFGESVDINTIPITKSGFDSIYISGITSFEEIPSLFDNVTLYAIEEQEGVKGIDVELSGVNLLDNGSARFTQYATFKKTETGFEIISNPTNNVVYVILRAIEAEAGKKYYIDFDCSFLNSPPTSARPNELHIRASNNEGVSVSGDTLITYQKLGTSEQLTHKRFSITMPSGYKYLKLFFYGSVISSAFVDYKAVFTNFIVSKDEEKPYQPYFASLTVNIPSEVTLTDGTVVPLHMGDGDKIVVNRNKVIYIESGWQEDISTRTFVDRTANSTFTDGRMWFQPNAGGIPLSVAGKGLCNVLGKTDSSLGDYNHFRVTQYQNSMILGLITTGFSSFAEFNTWKETNPIIVRLQRVTPIEYDLTDTEVGQNLLALAEATQNQTNTITATSEIPLSKKIITYAKWGGNSEN